MAAMSRGCLVVLVGLASAACSRTFQTTVIQPNPLVRPTETLRESEPAVIVTGDMELNAPQTPEGSEAHKEGTTLGAEIMHKQRYPLQNKASFTMVSRDRLRFHVQLEHKWQEYADLGTWDVYLEDDQGHRYQPDSVEHAKTRLMVTMWDQEIRSVRRNMYGDIVAVNDDGWKRRQPLGSLSVFRGNADFVFYKRDLFTRDLRWVRLVVTRPGTAFKFTWSFDDDQVAAAN